MNLPPNYMTENMLSVDKFASAYVGLSQLLYNHGVERESRYGDAKEILNFMTIIRQPLCRLTGGNYGRNLNPFFLMAEALWIWAGRKDVAFLDLFNSRMKEFSDDGKFFHAPYGFRLRHWGINSFDTQPSENQNHYMQGYDQILDVINLLHKSPNTRRAVMSIWNPDLDLGSSAANSKDLPCNDTIAFKVRDGLLFTTIFNRSNDLHWGLPTNLFQFSFLSEMICKILNLKQGHQVHLSQSLHVYLDNKLTKDMGGDREDNWQPKGLYDWFLPMEMDFSFKYDEPEFRLEELDMWVGKIINCLMGGEEIDINKLSDFSKFLTFAFISLDEYLKYKEGTGANDNKRHLMYDSLARIEKQHALQRWDYWQYCKNFFAVRIKDKTKYPVDFKYNL